MNNDKVVENAVGDPGKGNAGDLAASGNANGTGDQSNGVTIAGTAGSAFPTGCIGTP